ncbi:bacterial transcriptional activator domain-containing protein [Nocardioides terrisoli]|uniref:bacterial transcriptional activator domain-containing protein n=1 Tax=Nocardioides terrisoli TaxID=3388267 RepID=UPI00287B87AC|nr:bacterial transcriptional activator domain-containing protein [Nocardioides marmorisolisilvae]
MSSPAERLCTAAEAAMAAGEVRQAEALVTDALTEVSNLEDRVRARCTQARLALLAGRETTDLIALLRREAGEVIDTDPTAARTLLVQAVLLMLYAWRPDTVPVAEQAFALVEPADEAMHARVETMLGLALVVAGDPDRALGHLSRSTELLRIGGPPQEMLQTLEHVVVALAGIERYADAMTLCRRYVRVVRRTAADGLLPTVLCLTANTAFFLAELDEMEVAASEALNLARSRGLASGEAFARVCLALVLALRGARVEAEEHARAAAAVLDEVGLAVLVPTTWSARGLAALGLADWDAAVAAYDELARLFAEVPTPRGLLHWHADRLEALWRSGAHERAREALRVAEDGVELQGPWEQAVVTRAAALVDDTPHAEVLFGRALTLHEDAASPFERARTQLCFGEWLLDAGRTEEATAQLGAARAVFAELDTRGWRDRAAALLERACSPKVADGARLRVVQDSGPVRVQAFGPITLVRDDLRERVPMGGPGGLLRYLVAVGGSAHVDKVIDDLWPDAELSRGGERLRTLLARARRRFGPIVVRDGATIRWASGVSVDIDEFGELARLALSKDDAAIDHARAAMELVRGDVLPLERYADWAVVARERHRQQRLALLDLLAADHLRHGRLSAAADHLRRAIDDEPLDESRRARLAEILIRGGDRVGALAVLSDAERAADELGVPVSPVVRDLRRRVAEGGEPA